MKGTPTYTQVFARPGNTDEVITAGRKVYPRCFDRRTKETSDSFRSVILRLEPDFPRSVFACQPAPPLGSHRYGSVMRALGALVAALGFGLRLSRWCHAYAGERSR